MTAESIDACFSKSSVHGEDLKEMYGIKTNAPTACKLGALDFINDVRFAMPIEDIASKWREAGKPVFQYVVDQANPWQASSRPHHAVDLIFLFCGFDLSSTNPAAERVGDDMREKMITFIAGSAPWSPQKRYAFGPYGECKELSQQEFANRRRTAHFDLLRRCDPADLIAIFGGLAAGRIGFNN